MKRLSFNTCDDLFADFLEICSRENYNIHGLMSLLMFAFLTNSYDLKTHIDAEDLETPFHLCYGDLQ